MRFYRALLHLFPRSFRAEYGGEMDEGLRARVGGRAAAPRCIGADRDHDRRRRRRTPCASTRHPRAGRALRRCDRCGARPDSRSPRSSSPRSASAPRPRRSRSPITCCCGRCRSPIPIGWSSSPKTTRRIGYPRMEPSPPNYPRLEADGDVVREHRGLQRRLQRASSAAASRNGSSGATRRGRRVRAARTPGRDRTHAHRTRCRGPRRRIRWSSAIACGARASPPIPTSSAAR